MENQYYFKSRSKYEEIKDVGGLKRAVSFKRWPWGSFREAVGDHRMRPDE